MTARRAMGDDDDDDGMTMAGDEATTAGGGRATMYGRDAGRRRVCVGSCKKASAGVGRVGVWAGRRYDDG